MVAYVKAYIRWNRSRGDLYYGWRTWDHAQIVRNTWGW